MKPDVSETIWRTTIGVQQHYIHVAVWLFMTSADLPGCCYSRLAWIGSIHKVRTLRNRLFWPDFPCTLSVLLTDPHPAYLGPTQGVGSPQGGRAAMAHRKCRGGHAWPPVENTAMAPLRRKVWIGYFMSPFLDQHIFCTKIIVLYRGKFQVSTYGKVVYYD